MEEIRGTRDAVGYKQVRDLGNSKIYLYGESGTRAVIDNVYIYCIFTREIYN